MEYSKDIAYLISSERYKLRTNSADSRIRSIGIKNVSLLNKDRTLEECQQEGATMWYRAPGEDLGDRPFVSAGSPQVHLGHCRGAANHLTALRIIAEQEASFAYMVCEDDVLFHENYSKLVVDYSRHVPDDYDIVWIGYSDPCHTEPSRINEYVIKGGFWCMHCYVITPAGARKVLASLPFNSQIDWWLSKLAVQNTITGYAFDYWHDELAESGRCAYRPRGLAYQELLPPE
ncbi:hypothetical protein ACFL17_03725 [Pseudomonadota bacterium]